MTTIATVSDVARAVRAGVSIPGALRDLFAQAGTTAKAFCLKHGIKHPHLSSVVNQKEVPSPALLAALAEDFGGDSEAWAAFFPRPINLKGVRAAGGR